MRNLLLYLMALFFIGCTGQSAFTNYARTGDTVALALGGSPSHEINGTVNKADIQASIIDSGSNEYPVTLRNVFKLYSDPVNRYNYLTTYDYNSSLASITRYYKNHNVGLWVGVVDLVDPITGIAPPLATGAASLKLVSPNLHNTDPANNPFGTTQNDGYLDDISIEILSGAGTLHPFNVYGDLDDLEPLPQIQISFDNSAILVPLDQLSNAKIIGGIDMTLDFDEAFFDIVKYPPIVRGPVNDPRIKVISSLTTINGTNQVLRIIVMAADKGIVASPDPNRYMDSRIGPRKHSKIENLKIFIGWEPSLTTGVIDSANYSQVFQLIQQAIFDKDGNPLTVNGSPAVVPVITPLNL